MAYPAGDFGFHFISGPTRARRIRPGSSYERMVEPSSGCRGFRRGCDYAAEGGPGTDDARRVGTPRCSADAAGGLGGGDEPAWL